MIAIRAHSSTERKPASSVASNLLRSLRFTIPNTFSLPGAELVHHLLDGVQDGELALGIVQLEPFHRGFELVQALKHGGRRFGFVGWRRRHDPGPGGTTG